MYLALIAHVVYKHLHVSMFTRVATRRASFRVPSPVSANSAQVEDACQCSRIRLFPSCRHLLLPAKPSTHVLYETLPLVYLSAMPICTGFKLSLLCFSSAALLATASPLAEMESRSSLADVITSCTTVCILSSSISGSAMLNASACLF